MKLDEKETAAFYAKGQQFHIKEKGADARMCCLQVERQKREFMLWVWTM